MQTRHRSWLPISAVATVSLLLVLCVAASASPRVAPASVAIESVGLASSTGLAVIHIATSHPTVVKIEREAGVKVTARFTDAILAPDAKERHLAYDRPGGIAVCGSGQHNAPGREA